MPEGSLPFAFAISLSGQMSIAAYLLSFKIYSAHF